MKKILYLMGIDWYWIKQRPQIIAQMLAKDYDVTVAYYKELFVKQSLRKDNDELEKSIAVPAIPYRDKNKLAYMVQKAMFHKVMKHVQEYDMVWIGNPLLYRYLPKSYRGRIIYDCMDNYEALCGDENIQKEIRRTEPELVHRADVILASSKGLVRKIQNFGGKEKVVLIRNGFVSDKIYPPQADTQKEKKTYKIGYFGTVAEWFDFSLLLKSLENYPDLEYYLWGPVSGIEIPANPRIKLQGVVEHCRLWENVRDMDCLIMPFQINDIIRDVDPVKLYEYISMGKKIISVQYDEVERFSDFVNFYKTEEEFLACLKKAMEGSEKPDYSAEKQAEFLRENSWNIRYRELKKYIE